MIIQDLVDRRLAHPPDWLAQNCQYLTIMGSQAYGVALDSSDHDLYGFAIPLKSIVFPHLAGEIFGFGRQQKRFDQWQEHHIHDPSACAGHGRSYDVTVFSIVRYFHLAMECNPNIIDSLFTPLECLQHCTYVGQMVREQRCAFLHKGAFARFKGYAYAQLHKIASKQPTGKRAETVAQHGYDVKFAYHVVRLLLECEQILAEHDIDLQRDREQLKSIRRGEWTEPQLRQWAADKERDLESLYSRSTLRYGPDEPVIKRLLINCLEHHYGSLQACMVEPDALERALREIQTICNREIR